MLTAALCVSGVIAARALPSGIYPPLQFPRIVIVAHSGTLPPQSMSLIVTRPIEQVVMAVPGVRRVRSKSIRGAAEISAQFDAVDRHGRRASDGAEPNRGDHRRFARGHPAANRADDAGDFSGVHPQSYGKLPTPELFDYANFVLKPEIARIPGAGIIEVQASDTREIEVDPRSGETHRRWFDRR